MHPNSFEMDDHIPPQHSPLQRSSNYMPSSYLQKPSYPESSYDMGRAGPSRSDQQHQRYSWHNSYGQQPTHQTGLGFYGEPMYPLHHVPQPNHSSNSSMHHQMWGGHHSEQPPFEPDGIPSHNPPSIGSHSHHNYAPLFNESSNNSFYQQERNKHRRHSTNLPKSICQQLGYSHYSEQMDEEPGHENIHQDSSLIGAYDNPPSIYAKNNVDFDHFQEQLKPPVTGNSTPEKLVGYDNYFQTTSNRIVPPIDRPIVPPNPLAESLNCDSMFNSLNNNNKPLPISPSKEIYDEEDDEEEEKPFGAQPFTFSNTAETHQKSILAGSSNSTAAAAVGGVGSGFPSAQPGGTPAQACICNCKKTKCLKLYCECFAKLGYCGEGCHCHGCKNRPENEDERITAIAEAKQRSSKAFLFKITETEIQTENSRKQIPENLKNGCNCRRTRCLKKYCECFNAGAFCNHLCKCESCENHDKNPQLHSSKRIPGINPSSYIPPISSTSSSLQTQSRDNNRSSQLGLVQSQLTFPASSSFPQSSKLGIIGLSKFPLTLQSYQSSLRGGPPHSSLIGYVKLNSNETPSNEDKHSNYLPANGSTKYHRKLLFGGDNDDSEPASSSNPSLSNNNSKPANKLKALNGHNRSSGLLTRSRHERERKKSIQIISDDEDDKNGNAATTGGNRRESDDSNNPNKILEDLEKKVKEIEQFRLLLLQQEQQAKQGSASKSDVSSSTATASSNGGIITQKSNNQSSTNSSSSTSETQGKSALISQSPAGNSNANVKSKTPDIFLRKSKEQQESSSSVMADDSKKASNSSPLRNNSDYAQNSSEITLQKKKRPSQPSDSQQQQQQQFTQNKKDTTGGSPGAATTATAAALSHSETIEDEASSFVEVIDSESKQSDPLAQRSAQTSRQIKKGKVSLTNPETSSDKELACPNEVLSAIAPTAKPSEFLYDPSSFHTLFPPTFDNFSRNNHLSSNASSSLKQK